MQKHIDSITYQNEFNTTKPNRQTKLNIALQALNEYCKNEHMVKTGFGEVSTKAGYELSSIFFGDKFIRFDVYMMQRSIVESDEMRNGDMASFYWYENENKICFYSLV